MKTSQKTLGVNVSGNIMVWPANPKRSFLTIQNQSTLDILINVGAVPSASNAFKIPPGEEWNPANPPKGDVYAIGTADALVSQVFFTIEESA